MPPNTFEKIKNMLQEKLPFAREASFASFDITPHRDWFILVVLMIAIGAILVGAAAYLFMVINNDEGADIGAAGKNSFDSVHVEELNTILKLYSEKEKQFDALFNTPPNIIDPSL